MKKIFAFGLFAGLSGLAAASAQAQDTPLVRPATRPTQTATPAEQSTQRAAPTAPQPRQYAPLDAPTDEQSYRRETVFGINFNTQGGLIGGVNVRSSRVMDNNLLWFWSLEGVFFKNPKEQTVTNQYTGGSFTLYKTNYAFALRPSIGIQRILFRKAAEAGVQVNGLLSAGPSIGLLMPYYISYDYTWASQPGRGPLQSDVILDEQYDPSKHDPNYIIDRAPFFGGISHTQVVAGVHFRGALSFEYGRYRDAVAGAEVGFLLETYSKRLLTFLPPSAAGNPTDLNGLNKQFYPSVYLTLYIGHRN